MVRFFASTFFLLDILITLTATLASFLIWLSGLMYPGTVHYSLDDGTTTYEGITHTSDVNEDGGDRTDQPISEAGEDGIIWSTEGQVYAKAKTETQYMLLQPSDLWRKLPRYGASVSTPF